MPAHPTRIPARRLLPLALLGALGAGCSALDPQFGALNTGEASEEDAGAPTVIRFGRDLRPLLDRGVADPSGRGCKSCHYSTAPSHVGTDLGGLDLATLGSLRRGGTTSGAGIVIAGDPDRSAIVQKLEGTYGFGARMPRGSAPYWSAADIDAVRRWIAEGAKGADDE